jgi:hypothetical protein
VRNADIVHEINYVYHKQAQVINLLINFAITITYFFLFLWMNWNKSGGDLALFIQFTFCLITHAFCVLAICIARKKKEQIGMSLVGILCGIILAIAFMRHFEIEREKEVGNGVMIEEISLDSLNESLKKK